MGLLRVDRDKCEKEGICVQVCPVGILALDPDRGPEVRQGLAPHCIGCGHCVAACPHGALDNVRNPLAAQVPLLEYPVLEAEAAFAFLRSRRSIRCYLQKVVPREVLLRLLDIARYAPSGHNSQGLSYLVVEGEERLGRVCEIVIEWMHLVVQADPALAKRLNMPGIIKAHEKGEDRILRNAPHLVVATASKENPGAVPSTYLALEYVELYASALRLGTCWAGFAQVCAQQYPVLPQYLQTPDGQAITGMMMVGYPQFGYYRLPERNPLDVRWLGE
jgi:nitroreductase/NAD-dependent dihydropyrimidine dehydrogenase PreA subunit